MPSPISTLKAKLKLLIPFQLLMPYYRLKFNKPPAEIFTDMYEKGGWHGKESASGPGSDMEKTQVVRELLPQLIKELNIESILDVPCGDFNWMQHVQLTGIRYIGADVVKPVVEANVQKFASDQRQFLCLDLCRDSIPKADLILCRDCLPHLSNKHVLEGMKNIKASGAKYVLMTTYPRTKKNEDILTGWFRPLNLELPPVSLPKPAKVVLETPDARKEEDDFDKCLALWKISDLPD